MLRVIRFLGILPVLLIPSAVSPPQVIPEAHEIPNWPAPPYWTPAAAKAPGVARTKSLTTASAPLPFIAITPCRQYDSRDFTPLPQDTSRAVLLSGAPCGIPSSAVAVSVNITLFNISGASGNGVFQVGTATAPTSAWINFPPTEVQRSNAGALPLDDSDEIWVRVQMGSGRLDFVVDVNGYYDGSGALQLSLGRRAALDQFWTPRNAGALGLTAVGSAPFGVRSDGTDLWVANDLDGTVSRVRGSDARLLETWTGAPHALAVLVAMGKVFVLGPQAAPGPPSPGVLYRIDPSQAAGAMTTVATGLGNGPQGITFDGARIWTANFDGSVSIVTPSATLPWAVTTVTAGFSRLQGAIYDGANVWVTDNGANTLLKLDNNGAILQTVAVGSGPYFPAFDGTKIWVPNFGSDSVSVVQASDGAVLATLGGNGLAAPFAAAFDGQRILVVHGTASLWKAADLTPLGSFATSSESFGVCSDGVNFWLTLNGTNQLARY